MAREGFIEVTDTSINKKVLIGVKWIKAVFPLEDKTAIVVGDGYFNPLNNEDQPERYLVSESYERVNKALDLCIEGVIEVE
jgi:hypothetical protein